MKSIMVSNKLYSIRNVEELTAGDWRRLAPMLHQVASGDINEGIVGTIAILAPEPAMELSSWSRRDKAEFFAVVVAQGLFNDLRQLVSTIEKVRGATHRMGRHSFSQRLLDWAQEKMELKGIEKRNDNAT